MSVIFSFPGKIGDALHQFPIVYHWAQQSGQKAKLWMDEKTCAPLVNLFAAQPCVESVELKGGIENWNMGGQPWHFGLETKDYDGHTVYHLGFRRFPQKQLTFDVLDQCKVPLTVDPEVLANTPVLQTQGAVGEDYASKTLLLLHGMAVYPHTKSSPGFWKFIHDHIEDLQKFDEVLWIGSERDREVGRRIYPDWQDFDDGGDLAKTARLMASSNMVIGVGSSMVALAGALKIPCVRIHDPIGEHPRMLWSNLGDNQLNETEVDLRRLWPEFRDKWMAVPVHG